MSSAGGRLDGPAGEQLGLGSRDEHPGTDQQVDVAEVGDSGQVLQRLARRAARHQLVVPLGDGGRDLVDERQPRPLDAEDVGQQHLRVVVRRVDTGLAQPAGRGVDQRAPYDHVRPRRPRAGP